MTTYLLTWNPEKWDWKDLHDARAQTARGLPYTIDWRCANRSAGFGDRVFMLQQGTGPRGIFACGSAVGQPIERPRPDAPGKTAWYLPVVLGIILDPSINPIIRPERLQAPDLSAGNWRTRQSGIVLPDDVAGALERIWNGGLRQLGEGSAS